MGIPRTVPRTIATKPRLTAFVALYTLGLGIVAGWQGNLEFVFYTIVMGVFIGFILFVDSRVRFTRLTLWLLATWGLLHMAGGTVKIPDALTDGDKNVLYALRLVSWVPRYDQFVHVFGFFVAALACAESLAAAFGRGKRAVLSAGVCFGVALMSMGLGAVNEVLEFAVTLFVEDHGVGGYVNTGWDLVCNGIGAVLGGMAAYSRNPARDSGLAP
ncbi:MAG: DUF2238 domain-containing protein [Phycisphaeraceae bacterium]|nr:DUF2238 domain-containing protein [Phycisphaeraceae bacterium]MCW5761939.1 DUF2238 domain-containing protein [Phycisphaeraceae bacterium]